MHISRRFLISLGVAGIAVTALLKVCSGRLAAREKMQLKTALNRWEDEGGNPVAVDTTPVSSIASAVTDTI
jgi:hypothetical protein